MVKPTGNPRGRPKKRPQREDFNREKTYQTAIKEYQREHYKLGVMTNKAGYLYPEQINRLLEGIKNHKFHKKKTAYADILHMLVYLGIMTGKRLSEIRTLRYGDIIFENSAIEFKILKKKQDEVVKKEYPDIIFLNLWKYTHDKDDNPLMQKEDYLFPDLGGVDDGQEKIFKKKSNVIPIDRHKVDQYLKLIAVESGINVIEDKQHRKKSIIGDKEIHFHMLRHTFAVYFIKQADHPGDVMDLQKALDHSKFETTTAYLEFNTKRSLEKQKLMWEENNINFQL